MFELSKPVYIPSIEGCDIYNYLFREKEFEFKYIGMIPSSLELNKLVSNGLKTTLKKTNGKLLTSDVLNIKFKQKVSSGRSIVKKLILKIAKLDNDKIDYKKKLEDFIKLIESEVNEEKWREVSQEELRKKLYSEGFVYNGVKYIVYKRSSAKSRVGQCLFIKEKLHRPMIKWSRMSINFEKSKHIVDFPSLLAYESLVGSSIESTVIINPESILIIKDLESKFTINSNVIRTGENGYLDSFEEQSEIRNSLFDGESLLDSSYFTKEKGMMLLRNHMFKSAAFNCNIQEFLKSKCPKEIDYNEWKLSSIFDGIDIFAKDVRLITTPSSLKALKFSNIIGSEKRMWNHWKSVVKKDECIFGVCKNEKKSKHGFNDKGETIQQTSYQMLNSMLMSKEDIKNFTELEKTFIEKLKNNDDFFIKYIRNITNDINCNEMFADIYHRNRSIVQTSVFRKFRKEVINSHVTHVKNGKVRLHGDYCVMLGNPMEFLYHAIGQFNEENVENLFLKQNEVYTKMFDFKEITGFRNPHTSPSNVLVAKNTFVKDIDKFFNLTENIVCVNAVNFPLQDILSGCDYDSDTVLLIDDDQMLSVSKKVFGQYRVCVNQVTSSKKRYTVCSEDMANIDNELSKSQRYIGRTVNIGQLCISTYWDMLSNMGSQDELNELLKKVDVVTVLSGICIDLAKKMFDIDIGREIKYVSETKALKKEKPLFWKYVSQNDSVNTKKYNCPMDFLFEEMNDLDWADYRKDISLADLLVKGSIKDGDRKQQQKIFEYVDSMCAKINNTYASNLVSEERDRRVDDAIKYYKFYIDKLKISPDTMHSLLVKLSGDKKTIVASRLLGTLHSSQKSTFLLAFSEENSTF